MFLRSLIFAALLALSACGPQLGNLERGEEDRVVRAYNADTLELQSGLRVFLAEIDAPRRDDAYGAQAQGELEAMTLHRNVLLAYGGTRRWRGRPRDGQIEAPPEAAIAHVFVKSEGGRWFWLQHELVSRGAAYVRPRRDNHARTEELLEVEAQARAAERGLWREREYRTERPERLVTAALAFNKTCFSGDAPYRFMEARVNRVFVSDGRAALFFGMEDNPLTVVLFGESFSAWDGPELATLSGASVRVRGPLGVFRGQPQLCLDHASQLEVLPAN